MNEPYVLDLPNEWRLGETEKTHLLTIDTAGSIEDFESYDTAVLLTGAAAVTRDDSGLRVIPFSEFDEGIVINESLMSELTTALRAITPSLPWIAWGLVLALLLALPWIVGGLTWAMNLFFLLWGTVLVWIASNLMGRGMRYGELYRLGLFGVTGSVLLSFAFSMTGLELPLVAYLAFFGWMLYVLSTFPRRERADAAPLPPAQTLKKTPPKKPRA